MSHNGNKKTRLWINFVFHFFPLIWAILRTIKSFLLFRAELSYSPFFGTPYIWYMIKICIYMHVSYNKIHISNWFLFWRFHCIVVTYYISSWISIKVRWIFWCPPVTKRLTASLPDISSWGLLFSLDYSLSSLLMMLVGH